MSEGVEERAVAQVRQVIHPDVLTHLAEVSRDLNVAITLTIVPYEPESEDETDETDEELYS